MARFELMSPDGQRYEIEAPDDASEDQVMEYFQSNTPDPLTPPAAPDPTKPLQLGDQVLPPAPPPDNSIVRGTGMGRTALEQGLQGATYGFSDEITDRIGALIASGFTDESYGDLLKEARANTKRRFAKQFEENPVTAIGANIVGAVGTGLAGTATKTGGAIANSLRTGNLATRVGKSALAGAASGAAYGAGTAEEGERLEGAGKGALIGGVTGAAIPAVGAAAKSLGNDAKSAVTGLFSRNADRLDEAAEAIRDKSQSAYQAMRSHGALFTPQSQTKITTKIDDALKNELLLPELHGKSLGILQKLKDEAAQPDFGLERLDQWRRLLNRVPYSQDGAEDWRIARKVIDALDDAVDGLSASDFSKGGKQAVDALNTARNEWKRANKFDTVSSIIKKSDGDANYLKREFKKLLDNPKKLRGFTGEEKKLLEKAASLSGGEAMMKMLGKFGIDIGNSRLGNTALPVVSGILTQSPALPVAGTLARYGQKAVAQGKAESLLRAIESAAPKGQTPAALQVAAQSQVPYLQSVTMPASRSAALAAILANPNP